MFSGEFCLRLKPYLVVKIASDVLTKHCCQVSVLLAMIFCAPTAGCVLACLVSDCAIQETPRTSVPRVLACWHSDRPTWDMKNILYIWFSHFTLIETHQCWNYSLSLYFNKKDSPCWQVTQGSRYSSHARSLETSWWIGNKNCQILRHTHSKLRYMH